MSVWDSRIIDHPLHTILQQFRTALGKAANAVEDADAQTSLARLRNAEGYISRTLGRAEPALVAPTTLSQIQTQVQAALNEVGTFSSSKNAGHLANAHNHLDNALPQVRLIAVPESAGDIAGVQDAVVRFRRSAGQHLSRLEKRAGEIAARVDQSEVKLTEQERTVEAQKTRLDQAIQQFVQESAKAQSAFTSETAEAIAAEKTALSEMADETRKSLESLREEQTGILSVSLSGAKTAVEKVVADVEKHQAKAREIVGIIAATGIAGNYKQVADDEAGQAARWRWIALASMVGIVGFAIYAKFSTVAGSFDAGAFSSKVFVSLTFGIIAAYAGREAEKHRRLAQKNRRLYLEMASLDSYLNSLPDHERNAIKVAVADRIFGQAEEPYAGEHSPAPSILEFFKLLGGGR
jgi:hypothetical protein